MTTRADPDPAGKIRRCHPASILPSGNRVTGAEGGEEDGGGVWAGQGALALGLAGRGPAGARAQPGNTHPPPAPPPALAGVPHSPPCGRAARGWGAPAAAPTHEEGQPWGCPGQGCVRGELQLWSPPRQPALGLLRCRRDWVALRAGAGGALAPLCVPGSGVKGSREAVQGCRGLGIGVLPAGPCPGGGGSQALTGARPERRDGPTRSTAGAGPTPGRCRGAGAAPELGRGPPCDRAGPEGAARLLPRPRTGDSPPPAGSRPGLPPRRRAGPLPRSGGKARPGSTAAAERDGTGHPLLSPAAGARCRCGRGAARGAGGGAQDAQGHRARPGGAWDAPCGVEEELGCRPRSGLGSAPRSVLRSGLSAPPRPRSAPRSHSFIDRAARSRPIHSRRREGGPLPWQPPRLPRPRQRVPPPPLASAHTVLLQRRAPRGGPGRAGGTPPVLSGSRGGWGEARGGSQCPPPLPCRAHSCGGWGPPGVPGCRGPGRGYPGACGEWRRGGGAFSWRQGRPRGALCCAGGSSRLHGCGAHPEAPAGAVSCRVVSSPPPPMPGQLEPS